MKRVVILLCSALASGRVFAANEPTAEQVRFFESSVRPVLVEHCQKCHGAKQQWADLRLDSREAMLRGGESGPAVVPGKPGESLLIRAVMHAAGVRKMPPKQDKLTDRQIADLSRWVEMGAPFPATPAVGVARKRDPNHWAFQTPARVPVPAVEDAAWPRTPVDNFVLAKLEAARLRPAARADVRTLIRRVTFDLTGLPPSPDEVAAFVSDGRPDAYARLVDRLLASPAYGERWGRHWLDVARYADSNGLDENVAHGNAFRYRDYVAEALNRDKPFDRFVVEQLAGDLLPSNDDAPHNEQLIATGFLALGPKVLAETDTAKMQMDLVDEQVDTVGRAFLGLTLGCARCHDHKFDPIDTADYYGLAGIFKSTRTMESYTKIARWHEHPLPSPASRAAEAGHKARVAAKKQAVQALVTKADEQARKIASRATKTPTKLEEYYPETTKAGLKKLRDELTTLEKNPPDLPSAMGVAEDKIADMAIRVRGNPIKLGAVVPRHTPPVLRGPTAPKFSASESGRLQLADWLTDPRHPLTARVFVNRVWRWHLGKGLVRTPDNFGLLSEAPSHPELLDWLARRFVADGWSLKSLHRLILNSGTYQQGGTPGPAALKLDPQNRLFGRANVRRLEAEAVRDSLLAVAGSLDRTIGGSLLKVKNRDFFFDHTSKDLTDYRSQRRSLYLPIVRNNLFDLFQLLDYPDAAVPSGDRATTTVAPQALLMLNSDFVMQSSAEFAAWALAEPGDDDKRIARIYARAYGREVTADELRANRVFLADVDRLLVPTEPAVDKRRRRAWNALCHLVVAANEFVYVK